MVVLTKITVGLRDGAGFVVSVLLRNSRAVNLRCSKPNWNSSPHQGRKRTFECGEHADLVWERGERRCCLLSWNTSYFMYFIKGTKTVRCPFPYLTITSQ